MATRSIMQIELNSQAKKEVEKLSDRHGMTQVAMMSRIVEWFAEQDKTTQVAVIGRFGEAQPDAAVLLLKRMAERK